MENNNEVRKILKSSSTYEEALKKLEDIKVNTRNNVIIAAGTMEADNPSRDSNLYLEIFAKQNKLISEIQAIQNIIRQKELERRHTKRLTKQKSYEKETTKTKHKL